MTLLLYVWASLTIAAAVQSLLTRRDTDGLPELQGARVFFRGGDLRISSPIPLAGQVESAFLIQGYAVVMRTKVRAQRTVSKSDVIELSAQAMVPQAATGQPTADYGILRFQMENGRDVYCRVFLMSHDEIVALHRRRIELRSGRLSASGPHSLSRCHHCARRMSCDRPNPLAPK